MTRVYLPATLSDLEALSGKRSVPVEVGYAATERLAAEYPDADDDELAYAAMTAAGDDAAPARIVIAADLPVVEHPTDAGVVTPSVPVTLVDVASFHVATEAGQDDLAWFATQELDDLVRSLRRA